MSTEHETSDVPLSMLSDAGAWLVRLSGPLKTPATEEGFQRWLRENPLHGVAFREVSAEWDEADRLKRFTDVVIRVPGVQADGERVRHRSFNGKPWLALAAALILTVAAGVTFHLRSPGIATGINELRVVTLEDGTKVHLNTATRIIVAYEQTRRLVRLDSGEALFEVAKQPARPFIVTAGDRAVRALGTSFLVRSQPEQLSVTLLEGKVAISAAGAEARDSSLDAAQAREAAPVVLAPGQRLTWTPRERPKLDHPQVGKLLAWQQGKVAIENLPLAAAVAEMNRYSSVPLVLEQPQPADLLVSGVFTAGQSMSFARAMAQSYGLRVVDRGGSIELVGVGRSAVSEQQ